MTPHGGPSRLAPEHSERDRHLAANGRKRILALDGGGVRGVLSLGMLQGVEDILKARSRDPTNFRLCQYFDLIGGTSTGSIIATLLARGKSVREAQDMYLDLAPKIFKRAQGLGISKPKFDAKSLEAFLNSELGGVRLGDSGFKTGFALFTKRLDTGAPWVLSNHPDSRYWEPSGGKDLPNKDYPVAGLVRASAAAPYYFDAADVTISQGDGAYDEDVGIFLDGAVSAANNPSVHLLVMATEADYPFGWTATPDNLFMLSVGTGRRRLRMTRGEFQRLSITLGFGRNARRAVTALQAMIQDTELHALTVMQALSVPPDGVPANRARINAELERMVNAPIGGPARAFCTFKRVDASLEDSDCAPLLSDIRSEGARRKAISRMSLMDCGDPKNLKYLLKVGRQCGSELKPSDFPQIFDV